MQYQTNAPRKDKHARIAATTHPHTTPKTSKTTKSATSDARRVLAEGAGRAAQKNCAEDRDFVLELLTTTKSLVFQAVVC